MNVKKVRAMVVTAITLIILFDIPLAFDGIIGNTISEISLLASRDFLTIPYAVGVLIGHLFWPKKNVMPGRLYILIIVSLAVILVDIIPGFSVPPILPVLPGILVGHLLWSQVSDDS